MFPKFSLYVAKVLNYEDFIIIRGCSKEDEELSPPQKYNTCLNPAQDLLLCGFLFQLLLKFFY